MKSKIVHLSEIKANNFSLSPSDYIKDDKVCNLGDLVRKQTEQAESMMLKYAKEDVRLTADYMRQVVEEHFDKPFDKQVVDMHTEKARQVFGHVEITPEERRIGKALNFAEVYGTDMEGFKKGEMIVIAGARGEGKSLRLNELWEQFMQEAKRFSAVIEPGNLTLEQLQKNAKKLRTRIRKEKNPGIQKSLRKELVELEKEIHEFRA